MALASGEILLLWNGNTNNASLYNVADNALADAGYTNLRHWHSALVTLGQRIFVISGSTTNNVEEFFYKTKTW